MKQDMAEAKVDCEGGHAVTYKTAWLDYVRSVWAQASDQPEESEHGVPAHPRRRAIVPVAELLSNLVEIPFQANCRSVRRSRHPVDLATL